MSRVSVVLAVWAIPLLAGVASAGAVLSSCSRRGRAPRPNIVLILADDFGIDAVGCYGAEHVETPRIDRLAQEGLRFGYCYATPLCSPSRVELMTGRYPFRTGWVAPATPAASAV